MISGGAIVTQDIPPYTIAQGDRAKTVGINVVGLKRRGFSEAAIRSIKQAYKLMFRSGLRMEEALGQISSDLGESPELTVFLDFIRNSQRGIAR
jgi:UDP-N-acetylglucosamine acyltransferase